MEQTKVCKICGVEWIGQPCHIDHIIPLATAHTVEDVYRLCHYTNLRLLTPEDNMDKSDSLNWCRRKEEK